MELIAPCCVQQEWQRFLQVAEIQCFSMWLVGIFAHQPRLMSLIMSRLLKTPNWSVTTGNSQGRCCRFQRIAYSSSLSSGCLREDSLSMMAVAMAMIPRRMKTYSAWIAALISWTLLPGSVMVLVKIFPT